MSAGDLDAFKAAISESLADARVDPDFEAVQKTLRAATESLQSSGLVPNAEFTIEPGHEIRLGRQFNVVVQVPERKFRDALFRAYVPPAGFPVSLDFYGEDLVTVNNLDQLRRAILDFIGSDVRTRLKMLSQ